MNSKIQEKKVSVIIPVCEHASDTLALVEEYRLALSAITNDMEFIYAVNYRFQKIAEQLEQLATDNTDLKVLLLSRDYGEGTVLQAAFEHVTGDYVLTLPPYKQVDLSELPKMFDAIDSHDVVMARRWPRLDSTFKRFQTKVFNTLIGMMTDQKYSDSGCGVRLLTADVIKELNLYGDQHRFLHLLTHELGFKTTEVNLTQARENIVRSHHNPGTYLRRLLDLLTIVFLTKFNKKPLRFFGIIGSTSMALGFLGLLYMAYERLFLGVAMADRPLLVLLSLFLVLGIQLIGIGLIGETIIFTHAENNKEYRIKRIIN